MMINELVARFEQQLIQGNNPYHAALMAATTPAVYREVERQYNEWLVSQKRVAQEFKKLLLTNPGKAEAYAAANGIYIDVFKALAG